MATRPEQPAKRRGRPPSGGREAILTATLELLHERGIAKLTTREVAERAGVSEASVFYHYTDRAGLLQAVFARGLEPLEALNERGIEGEDHAEVLGRLGGAIERFLEETLPVLFAAQSDVALRDALAAYMVERDLGPHRGVEALAAYIAAEQEAGRVRADVDPAAAALMLISSSFMRAFQQLMIGKNGRLPTLEETTAALDTMLRP